MIEERGIVESVEWDSAQWLASYQERLDRLTANVRTAKASLRQAGHEKSLFDLCDNCSSFRSK